MPQNLRCPKCGHEGLADAPFCPKDGNRMVVPEVADPFVGKVLDQRYEIIEKLGQGAMGAVYKARNKHVPERLCAIKVIQAEHAKDPDYRARFIREANALMRARHRNIVTAFDVHETADGHPFLVMEFLKGRTVESAIRDNSNGFLPLSLALHIAVQTAAALEHAHKLRIIHRDIKPGNILLVQEEGDPNFVKVLDFGLARLLDQNAITVPVPGMAIGTLGYIAPEVCQGGDYLSPALDVYSFGCSLIEMLTGRLPFEIDDVYAMIQAHLKRTPPRLAELRPEVRFPREAEDLVRDLLAKKREDRPSLAQTLTRLHELIAKLPKRSAQSMMILTTLRDVKVPTVENLHDKSTQIKPDARARNLEGLVREVEKTEEDRERASQALEAPLSRLIKELPASEVSADVAELLDQRSKLEAEDQNLAKKLTATRSKRERERQLMEGRKSELHELIVKVRSDIRRLPPETRAQAKQDEATLADLEKAFFAVQPEDELAEQVVNLILAQQRIRHRLFVLEHELGTKLVTTLRERRSAKPLKPMVSAITVDLDALEWSLDLLGRCNQNIEVLLEELPELR